MAGNKIRKAAAAAAAVAYCKIRPERPFFPTSSLLPPFPLFPPNPPSHLAPPPFLPLSASFLTMAEIYTFCPKNIK